MSAITQEFLLERGLIVSGEICDLPHKFQCLDHNGLWPPILSGWEQSVLVTSLLSFSLGAGLDGWVGWTSQ